MGATQVPTVSKIKELERELALRRAYYPQRVAAKKLDENEAAWRITVLESILDDYRKLQRKEPQPAP